MTEIVCFHNPDEENGWLSNWYVSPFEIDGTRYCSVEQYMMHTKARAFGDAPMAKRILAETSPAVFKEPGRQVAGYVEPVWNGIRQIVVYRGLLAKFSQDDVLLRPLLATGDAVLAECAVHDRIWGIGLSMRDPARLDMGRWRGQNLLGFSLMQVRERLRGTGGSLSSLIE